MNSTVFWIKPSYQSTTNINITHWAYFLIRGGLSGERERERHTISCQNGSQICIAPPHLFEHDISSANSFSSAQAGFVWSTNIHKLKLRRCLALLPPTSFAADGEKEPAASFLSSLFATFIWGDLNWTQCQESRLYKSSWFNHCIFMFTSYIWLTKYW